MNAYYSIMKFMFFTLSFIIIWLFVGCFGIGRRISERDQTLCKIKLSDKLEEIKEVKDPYAIAMAYYVSFKFRLILIFYFFIRITVV